MNKIESFLNPQLGLTFLVFKQGLKFFKYLMFVILSRT